MLLINIGRILSFLLGIFEFISSITFYYNSIDRVENNERLTPIIIASNDIVKVLFCVYLITLGIQRLSWSLGNGGILSWLLLLLTHLIEWFMWCYFATLSSFRGDLSLNELIIEVITLKSIGGLHAFIVLILLPILILFFIIMGPGSFQSKTKSKTP
mmetsp:Transcript_2477/g.2438  ORF Transcript_2477/g.2438 Transcript_2477/m.2438 type:complete len:157 (-) Transcript_2477:130-600(-)